MKCCLLLTLAHLFCSSVLLSANHLSPQALKWREYRRKNPLGPPGLSGSLDRRPQEARLARRNPIFEFPGSFSAAGHLNCRPNGVWAGCPVDPGQALPQLGRAGEGAGPQERVPEGMRHRTELQLLEGELLEIDFSLLSRSNSEAITTDLP